MSNFKTQLVKCDKCNHKWQGVFPSETDNLECPKCHEMSELPAISVIDECSDIYYDSFDDLPEDVKESISLRELKEIFEKMVIPTIDKARALDRS